VSWLADLTAVASQLGRVGGGARLEMPTGAIQLGRPLPAGPTRTVALEGEGGARLVVAAPPPIPGGWSTPHLAGAGACAALALIGAALLWRRRPAASPATTLGPTVPAGRGEVGGGSRIGRYTVLRRLGSGGMAEVYLARAEGEAGFERQVALKVMHDDMVSDANFVSHFLDEARLASKLSHPNIVSITDLGKEGEKYVIAMEYIDGADLERLLHGAVQRAQPLPIPVAFAIARRICDGLHFAHTALDEKGAPLHLVHRDVKSANVFVARTGAVKIGDFGIAKVAGTLRTAKTEFGQVKGTAAYMAPEQRLGQDVDQRADVYAVGAICYELFTGHIINLDLAMLAHLGRVGWPHLPRPSDVRAKLPPELDDVVFRAMAFDRDDRYASCEELEQALAAIAERHGVAGSTDKAIAQWITAELQALEVASADRTEVGAPMM
jgi:serine/threonine-protein kinase